MVDNCEHLIGGCAKTAETLLQRCPQVHLLATSREPLGIAGERLYRVPPLSLPEPGDDDGAAARSCDAVALLADRAGAHSVSLNLTSRAIALSLSVCRRLDGMPLAIELAAARLRSMSLGELSGRLDQRFRLLTGGSRTAAAAAADPARGDQLVLTRCLPLPSSCCWPACRYSPGASTWPRPRRCAGTGPLTRPRSPCCWARWWTRAWLPPSRRGRRPVRAARDHPAIRRRAASRRWPVRKPPRPARRTAAHYQAVAEAAAPHLVGPEQGIWLDRLEADHANLRRAAEHAASQPDGTARVLRFGIALRLYWVRHLPVRGSGRAAGACAAAARSCGGPGAVRRGAAERGARWPLASDLTLSMQLAEQMDQVAGRLGGRPG